ncbi:uncharacterized protein LOC128630398 isoform X2 [Ictalurus punctatus]|uniref:Uncharacterized protein LOC128630398 isoform X2 n=1 Tax=Ictalurus punctatus TaxID=7998 RepID=A0A9F7RGR2_ICTPU|nr:uncharacterized protein LOC128630398 isoform X2 [Ictalurus punctatus]
MIECFNQIAEDSECPVVVFSGAGKIFTAVYFGYRQRKLSESLRDRMERTQPCLHSAHCLPAWETFCSVTCCLACWELCCSGLWSPVEDTGLSPCCRGCCT